MKQKEAECPSCLSPLTMRHCLTVECGLRRCTQCSVTLNPDTGRYIETKAA